MTEKTIPPGYWEDANGALIPISKIKDIDKDRHRTVSDLCQAAIKQHAELAQFKAAAMAEVSDFIQRSLAQYEVQHGGKKGNVTLTSFDGKFKLVRQMQDRLVFGEQLLAAKALIDECVQAWSKDANDNIRALVNHAFQTDKEGKINTGRVLGLRSLDIQDEAWKQAMQAIADSTKTASTTPYVRFYERDEGTGEYRAISLDVAAV